MFVLVVGGGKVGYYLTKELIESGHEVVLMEKDRARSDQIADEIGSVVIPHDGCEGKYLGEAGCNRADIVAAVTGDDEDNLVICQMAKHHFDVPADDRPGQQPQERGALQAPRRRRDHQPDADDPRLDRAGHPGPRAPPPGGARRGRARADRGPPPGRLAGDRQGDPGPPRSPRAARCSRSSATASPRRSGRTRSSRRATRSSRSAGPSARRSSTSS